MKKGLGPLVAAALATVPAAAGAQRDALDREVAIVNGRGHALTGFEATRAGRGSWGRDRLGERTIAPGGSMVLEIKDGTSACAFDFRARFADGETIVGRAINVCRTSSYIYD